MGCRLHPRRNIESAIISDHSHQRRRPSVKKTGDGFPCLEFPSVVGAIEAAIVMQSEL